MARQDAAIRRTAVATGDDTDLIRAAATRSRRPDAGVRLAALKRLNDYENWRERSTGDADGAVRETCRNSYLALLCAATSQPPLARRIAELDTLSVEGLERVATSSVDRELRAAALAQVSKPAVLADRAVADPDAACGSRAGTRRPKRTCSSASRRRHARRTRTCPTRTRTLEAMRIAAGAATTIETCACVVRACRCPDAHAAGTRSRNSNRSTRNGEASVRHVPAELSARYHGARVLRIRAAERAHNPPPPGTGSCRTSSGSAVTRRASPPAPLVNVENTEQLASRARFDAALAAADERRARRA